MTLRPGEIVIILFCVGLLAVVAVTQLVPSREAATEVVVATQPAAVEPAETPVAIVKTSGPVTYYINHCARCHGDPETAYPDSKAHARNDELKRMIRSMATDTAMVEIDDAEVERQFALHNGIFDNKPYAWIDPTRKDVIAGETVPGTTIRAGAVDAKIDNHQFTLPNSDAPISATRNGETITIAR